MTFFDIYNSIEFFLHKCKPLKTNYAPKPYYVMNSANKKDQTKQIIIKRIGLPTISSKKFGFTINKHYFCTKITSNRYHIDTANNRIIWHNKQ